MPEAKIRPYAAEDRKLVQFMVGKSNMEALAVANYQTYFHPLFLTIWFACAAAFVQLMGWWPTDEYGFWGYLKPLPALGSTAIPILYYVDWKNRPYFEDLTQEILRYRDLQDIPRYYKEPGSGFFILEYGDKYVGLIATDATQAADTQAPKTAIIRHFHVDESYRKVDAQNDLLEYAVRYAFENDPDLKRIAATDSPLISYLRPCFRANGFDLDHHTKTVGLLGWKMGTRYLERSKTRY